MLNKRQTAAKELRAWLDETANEPLENMDAFFDKRISDYEEHMLPWREHYEYTAKLVPPETQTLLDIGAGSGLELDCIFKRFPELDVTAVDLSGKMLEKLSKKHGSKHISLIRANYFEHDLGKNKFDCVIAFQTLHHFSFEKKKALFEKIRRALTPNGVYIECDYVAVSEEIERLTFSECERRRKRDGIPPDVFVHFDTPLTLEHELSAMREGGLLIKSADFLPNDDHTAIILANKR